MIALYPALYAVMSVFAVTSWGLAAALGAQVSAVSVGWPRLFSVGRLRLGLLPLTSWTQLRGRDGGEGNWFQLGPRGDRRLAITLGPLASYLLAALLLLGPDRAAASIRHGFTQLFITPDTTPVLRAFVAFLRSAPPAAVFGVVFAKCFVVNILTAAGSLLQELRAGSVWNLVAMLVGTIWCGGRLLWGLYHALFT